jgi:hypothetical protein
MIDVAKPKVVQGRITFSIGDVRRLRERFAAGSFDVIITNRCLINLLEEEEQFDALRQISQCLTPNGHYLGTENFMGGQNALNSLRRSLDLAEIPVRWHNRYFDEIIFIERAGKLFKEVELLSFSSTYYLVTRVVYSALCKREGAAPGYDHPIYDIATALPPTGNFSPIKMIVARGLD